MNVIVAVTRVVTRIRFDPTGPSLSFFRRSERRVDRVDVVVYEIDAGASSLAAAKLVEGGVNGAVLEPTKSQNGQTSPASPFHLKSPP